MSPGKINDKMHKNIFKRFSLLTINFSFALTCLLACNDKGTEDNYVNSSQNIDKYNVDRSGVLSNKEWQAYDIDGDTLYLPITWKYHIHGETFMASRKEEADSVIGFSFSRYFSDGMAKRFDSIAKSYFKKQIGNSKQSKIKKFTFEYGILYGLDTMLIQKNKPYTNNIMIYVKDKYYYTINFKAPNDSSDTYPKELFNNIIMNIKIDSRYIFSNDNKLKTVELLEI